MSLIRKVLVADAIVCAVMFFALLMFAGRWADAASVHASSVMAFASLFGLNAVACASIARPMSTSAPALMALSKADGTFAVISAAIAAALPAATMGVRVLLVVSGLGATATGLVKRSVARTQLIA